MSEVMKLIQEADNVAIEMERARFAVEAAKLALEAAKENFDQARAAFDQTLARADEIGVPRAKIKKLIEDRTSALVASGLIPTTAAGEEKPKAPRPPKAAKKAAAKAEAEREPEPQAESALDDSDFATESAEAFAVPLEV